MVSLPLSLSVCVCVCVCVWERVCERVRGYMRGTGAIFE